MPIISNWPKGAFLFVIIHLSVCTFFEKACIIKLNADVETGNSKLGNASASLCFSQFQIMKDVNI